MLSLAAAERMIQQVLVAELSSGGALRRSLAGCAAAPPYRMHRRIGRSCCWFFVHTEGCFGHGGRPMRWRNSKMVVEGGVGPGRK